MISNIFMCPYRKYIYRRFSSIWFYFWNSIVI